MFQNDMQFKCELYADGAVADGMQQQPPNDVYTLSSHIMDAFRPTRRGVKCIHGEQNECASS